MGSTAILAVIIGGLVSPTTPLDTKAPFPLSCSEPAKAHVFDGWNALSHARFDAARDSLAEALAADPDCVLARAMLGTLLVGARGQRQFDLAWSRREQLKGLERLELERLDAQRKGELDRAYRLAARMAKSAPDHFFAHVTLAHAAQALERWDESAFAAHRAITLAPRNGAGWNLLGYAHLRSGRRIEAVAAFKRYADVCPYEPNASDSLGEALLEAGQYDDAEAAFRQALARSKGTFTQAWSGIAAAHAHRGDWSGARAALATQRKQATQHTERLRTELMVAWTWAAENRFDTAVQVTRSLEREAKRAGLDAVAAEASVLHAQLELLAGRPASALNAFTAAGRLGDGRMTKRQQLEHRVNVLTGLTVAQARLGRVKQAQQGLVELRNFVRDELPGPLAGDSLVFAHGAVSRARSGPAAAIESWLNCSPAFALCRLSLLEAQERSGRKMEGEETRTSVQKATRREPSSWFLRAKLEAKRRISGT